MRANSRQADRQTYTYHNISTPLGDEVKTTWGQIHRHCLTIYPKTCPNIMLGQKLIL